MRRLGYYIASDIIHRADLWSDLDDRWIASDGHNGWVQLGWLQDQCNYGGWSSCEWRWTDGWVVDEGTMSEWSFFTLHMIRLRVRIAAGYSHVSW